MWPFGKSRWEEDQAANRAIMEHHSLQIRNLHEALEECGAKASDALARATRLEGELTRVRERLQEELRIRL